jgi:hypothetical protein
MFLDTDGKTRVHTSITHRFSVMRTPHYRNPFFFVRGMNPSIIFQKSSGLASYLFNQEWKVLNGGLKLPLLNCFSKAQKFRSKYLHFFFFDE